MSKENPLSHHEQLRYDYLLKNIYYLNEREKNEFVYLQDKLSRASSDATSESQELTKDYRRQVLTLQFLPIIVVVVLRDTKRSILFQRKKQKSGSYGGGVFLLDCLPF